MNPMISYTDSCNCSDSSDIELSDEWVGKKSPKLSRGNRSHKFYMSGIISFFYTLHKPEPQIVCRYFYSICFTMLIEFMTMLSTVTSIEINCHISKENIIE